MVLCAVFAVLIAVGAFIRIPVPVCPFTLQFFFTAMAGIVLGGRRGAISVSIYMVLGLIGLPIFAEGGGIWYVLKPTFGYIPGFIAGTYITGRMAAGKEDKISILIAAFAGLLAVYACGMIYYYLIANFAIGSPIGVWPLFLYCFLLAVPGDIVLCLIAALLGSRVRLAVLR